jgi:ribose transport system substrate-binding protein
MEETKMNIKRMKTTVATAALAAASLTWAAQAQAQDGDKFKIYLSLSYSGNAWQSEAANIVKALAATPPYDTQVELIENISGTDPQAQIAAYESMIDDGADAIISFPISSTALNRTIRRGCEEGVLFFMYDGTVTEDCAYNVSFLSAGFGENTAQALVNELGGKGKIFLSRGVPGNSVDQRHTDGAMSVFKKYPGIEIVAEYYSFWDDRTTQQETAKALAAHPQVDGVWAQAGEYGVIQALLDADRPLVPMTGENSAGFRRALADPDMQAKGLRGVSSGSGPAQSGYAFKLAMEILTGQRELAPQNIEYPLPWVPAADVKICEGDSYTDGCNVFPESKVPSSFVSEVLNPVLLPEINVESALNGTPVPGATIQPLPADAVVTANNEPGINCDPCEAAPDMYKLTKVEATVQP